jgi:hypothetical protein
MRALCIPVDSKSLLDMHGKCHLRVQIPCYKHNERKSHYHVQLLSFLHTLRNNWHWAAHWAANLPQEDIQNMEQSHYRS